MGGTGPASLGGRVQAEPRRAQVESLGVVTWGDHMVTSVMEALELAGLVRLGHIHMRGEEVGCQHFRLGP